MTQISNRLLARLLSVGLALALPAPAMAHDRHSPWPQGGASAQLEQSRLKSNAHTLQIMVESYAVDHGGLYPTSAAELLAAAKQGGYGVRLTNVVSPYAPAFVDGDGPIPGAVSYRVLPDRSNYRIHIWNRQGLKVRDLGRIWCLSNG